jgi:hypothetical protein
MEISPNRKNIFSENPESFLYWIFKFNNEVWDYKINSTTGELKANYIGEK